MNPLIIILGPTASGKTALGIELAKKFGGAVISADSRQVYAGLNIGTAKPPAAFQDAPHDVLQPDIINGVSHYLLNVVFPATTYPLSASTADPPTWRAPYTLAQWQQDAYTVIDKLFANNALPPITASGGTPPTAVATYPLITGGTMLYLDSIIFNYHIPAVPPNIQLRADLSLQNTDDLYQQLIAKDPAAADFIEPHHQQRIIRALEVITATGQPFSASRKKGKPRYEIKIVGLFPGWEVLQKNIEKRAQQMITDGLIEETRILREKYSPALPLLKTMNYLQAGQVIDGKLSPEEAVNEMVKVNMRYAHRQMSWWKNRQDIQWFDPKDSPQILKAITSL